MGAAAGFAAIIFLVIIAAIIIWVWNSFQEDMKHEDKLLKLGCDPKAWNQFGSVTIWSCPADLHIDVNKPETFMNR
ncbi:MAG TPA: hypothetical protein VE076_05205 [Nitrososphaeraceae archaeon]|jgi:hypothetical protein|nr:hypothetical protein [Nitrososphaeraceae archaeon]